MPGLTKFLRIFLYIAPFPALAFFKVWASLGRDTNSLLIAACAMFVYCLFVLGFAARCDRPSYFDWTICGYFLALTLSLALWPETTGEIVTEYAVTGIYLCLFIAAFVPPILGMDPFTYHYAKKSAPKAVWSSPIFSTINRIMTFVWSGIFATCTLLSLYPSVVTRAVVPVAMIVGAALSFNRQFPRYYLKRLGLPPLADQRGLISFPQTIRLPLWTVDRFVARRPRLLIPLVPSRSRTRWEKTHCPHINYNSKGEVP